MATQYCVYIRIGKKRVGQFEGILQAVGISLIILVLETSIIRLLLGLRQPIGRTVGQTARREEEALAAEFGPEWQAYASQVPAFLPNFKNVKRPIRD